MGAGCKATPSIFCDGNRRRITDRLDRAKILRSGRTGLRLFSARPLSNRGARILVLSGEVNLAGKSDHNLPALSCERVSLVAISFLVGGAAAVAGSLDSASPMPRP